MDEVEVSTIVFLPPEAVFEFLVDFPRYANYSKHLEEVRRDGDGGPGTEYALRFAWWKLTYTARSRVTAVDPPRSIDWRLVKDVRARGRWIVEEVPEEARDGDETASRVRLRIAFDADSADAGVIDLPLFVSIGWVVERVKPLVLDEAERVVERIVADLEGEPRHVTLTIRERPSTG